MEINSKYIDNKLLKDFLLSSEIKISMREFSRLHVHMVVFIAITNIGDTVLILHEKSRETTNTKSILERLGLRISVCMIDYEKVQENISNIKNIIDYVKPKFLFVISEALKYENFSWLNEYNSIYKIYDASQYLSNITEKDYINPFHLGFDAVIFTSGTQRVLFCTKSEDKYWNLFNSNISTYVSKPQIYSS